MSSFMSRLVVLLAITPLLTSANAFADARRPVLPPKKAPAAAAPDCELSGGVDHLRSVKVAEIFYDDEGKMHTAKQETKIDLEEEKA